MTKKMDYTFVRLTVLDTLRKSPTFGEFEKAVLNHPKLKNYVRPRDLKLFINKYSPMLSD